MCRLALNCFEDRDDGSWVCIRSTTVNGPAGHVPVLKGQSFRPGTVFAGYNNFTAHLASVSVPSQPVAPHEG